MGETRKLAAILVSDVVGYSRLTGADEDRILARLRTLRSDLIDPTIAVHHGRVVKRTGDGAIVEFRSVVDAVNCAIEVQRAMVERNAGVAPDKRIEFRIGIHLGDVVEESDGDLMGDGVNIAARLEGICDPGGIVLSGAAHEHARDRFKGAFVDLGEKALKNIARPIRVYGLTLGRSDDKSDPGFQKPPSLSLPDKPSIAVLPFQNMSGDPEQDYFADGMVEDIVTGLSRIKWLFVIARNSSFVYKGKAVDVRQVGRELGVRYVLEGGVRKAGNRLRVTAQLVEAESGAHLWADKFDGELKDIFELQDQITESVVGIVEPSVQKSEIERSRNSASLATRRSSRMLSPSDGRLPRHQLAISLNASIMDTALGTPGLDAKLWRGDTLGRGGCMVSSDDRTEGSMLESRASSQNRAVSVCRRCPALNRRRRAMPLSALRSLGRFWGLCDLLDVHM